MGEICWLAGEANGFGGDEPGFSLEVLMADAGGDGKGEEAGWSITLTVS
jgi:hypothetical protein